MPPAIPALTGLRFLAALAVVIVHFGAPFFVGLGLPGYAPRLASAGYLGVNFFFLLSGFILAYNYLSGGTMRGTHRAFWVARAARVLPVYWLAWLLALPLYLANASEGAYRAMPHQDSAVTVALSGVLVQSWWPHAANFLNAPGWSLSTEVLFYAAFPLIGVWLTRQSSLVLLATVGGAWVLALLPAVMYLALRPDAGVDPQWGAFGTWLQVVKFNPVVRLPEFVMGIALGCLFLRRRTWPLPQVRPGMLALLAVAGVVLLVTRFPAPFLMLHSGLLDPLFAMLIVSVAYDQGVLTRVLGSPVFVLLGEASYALYLLHVPAWDALARFAGVPNLLPWGFPAFVALVTAISVLVFRVFEEPMRHRIRRVLAPRRASLTAATN